MRARPHPSALLLCLLSVRPAWAAAAPSGSAVASSATATRSAADLAAARFCRPFSFHAYSTIEPSGRRVEESLSWDASQQAYLVRGPILAMMLDDPGTPQIPAGTQLQSSTFRLVMRGDLSAPIDRFCQYGFQESAECDPHGTIYYTQVYTDCELQRLKHVVRLTPDSAGALPLLDISVQDVQGVFSDPLVISAGTDLRLRIRN